MGGRVVVRVGSWVGGLSWAILINGQILYINFDICMYLYYISYIVCNSLYLTFILVGQRNKTLEEEYIARILLLDMGNSQNKCWSKLHITYKYFPENKRFNND